MSVHAAIVIPTSCAEVKTKDGTAQSGKYTIRPITKGKAFSVYCNMEDYGGGWTLVTLVKSDKSDQWNPLALYPEDLATFTTSPSRVSKLSDAEINALLGTGGTRWVTAGTKGTFYRMTDRPWYSDHGVKDTCAYKRDFHDAMAVPSTKPVWETSLTYTGCGGAHDGKDWGALSGMHAKSNRYTGAFRVSKWKQNGYVFVRSGSFGAHADTCSSFVTHAYICKIGQLQSGTQLKSHSANSKDACAAACDATSGCLAFDFTTIAKIDACRLAKSGENGQSNAGSDNRQHCVRPGA